MTSTVSMWTSLIAFLFAVASFMVMYRLQERLTRMALQNETLHRFRNLGVELLQLNIGAAKSWLPEFSVSNRHLRNLERLEIQNGFLSLLQSPIRLHFDDGKDGLLTSQLERMLDAQVRMMDLLNKNELNKEDYEQAKKESLEAYTWAYADMALQTKKGKRASIEEIDEFEKFVLS